MIKKQPRIAAVIPAAGSGRRMGLDIPKQFIRVRGKEILAYTLEIFQMNRSITEIVVAADPLYFSTVERIAKKYAITKLKTIVPGGKERADSVLNALFVLAMKPDELVAVHDAARPLLPSEVLANSITLARRKGSALTAIKAPDTILSVDRSEFGYLDRSKIYIVQTPQIFRFGDLMKAYSIAKKTKFTATDESMLMRYAGFPVSIAEGSPLNFKITTKADIETMKKILGKK
jgi:2-C-methyl-D-erythritol 4-phosphate cytidylyltransferase